MPERVSPCRFSPAVALQGLADEPQRCGFVARFGHVGLQDLAFVIHRAPKVVSFAVRFF